MTSEHPTQTSLPGDDLKPAWRVACVAYRKVRQEGQVDQPAWLAARAAIQELRPDRDERAAGAQASAAVHYAATFHTNWLWRDVGDSRYRTEGNPRRVFIPPFNVRFGSEAEFGAVSCQRPLCRVCRHAAAVRELGQCAARACLQSSHERTNYRLRMMGWERTSVLAARSVGDAGADNRSGQPPPPASEMVWASRSRSTCQTTGHQHVFSNTG